MKQKTYPLYFVMGALGLYIVFIVFPGILGIALSFTDWNSYSSEIHYVGLGNFRTVFSSDEHYVRYLQNTLIFSAYTIILKTIIGMLFALLLNYGVRRLTNLYRVVIFLPVVLPMLIVGLVFRSILNPKTGVLNGFFRGIGLDSFAQRWLVDPHIALNSVIAVDTWKGVGYIMVILLAALQSIPTDYYEAAAIDGANAVKRLRYVTLPLMMPAIAVVTVLNLLYGLRVFDIVYVMTKGGPGYTTEVVFTSVFREFSKGRYGVGTALSSVLFIVMITLGFFVIRTLTREPVEA
jgi:raffinose/stachyose/melibiose transport system permease protein